jgi:small GTP-binding protein
VKVALVGQPNSGKSTVFNAVAGYRSLTSNFAGTTVEYTRGQARVGGVVLDLIDLPGLYSLTPTSSVEEVSRDFLLDGDWDVIINVVDASQMARSLELTLELLDLESPMVVCLNMMDEAARKGMTIDTKALATALGVPVVEAIGGRGRGIGETFRAAQEAATHGNRPCPFVYAPEVESILEDLAGKIGESESDRLTAHQRSTPLPVFPSRAMPVANVKCLGGCCDTSCGGHNLASAGHQAGSNLQAPTQVAASVAIEEPVTHPPLASVHTDFHGTQLQSQIANHQLPLTVFPPARYRAIQFVQSEPRQMPTAQGAVTVGVPTSDLGRRTSDSTSSHLPLTTSHSSSDLGLRTSDLGLSIVDWARAEIAARTGQPADAAVSSARHAACLNLFERVAHVSRPKSDWRERVDHVAMHPIWGYVVLAGVFLGFFRLIFDVGKLGEDRILMVFDVIAALLTRHMDPQSALFAAVKGGVLGTAGAVAIVLPYLLPFLAGLAILEDIGYLSRVGYLMDAAMHRLGLHGTATLPVLVGYGCSVPAVMATRILTTRRDRFIAAFLAVLVPCSARMTVIFALVGFYLGANYALGIYILNIIIVALSGTVLARIWPEISPGMLMEVPAYRVPGVKVVALKTWWRLREFVLVAFPLLVVGSIVLSLVDFYGWQHGINAALSPLTSLLGLPRSVGLTLIFGVLRKELSLLMLMQALGTTHVLGAMTAAQILIFTLFVTFYLPCMATLASMMRELGWRLTLAASTALLTLAIVISLAARGVMLLF